MDMGFSSEQVAIRDSIRKFLRAENPIAVAREATQNSAGYAVDIWRKISELGWPGIGIPEQYGGGGLGLQELALMYEEFGRALYQGPHFGGAFLCGQLVLKLGSETQKQELLPAMASGSGSTWPRKLTRSPRPSLPVSCWSLSRSGPSPKSSPCPAGRTCSSCCQRIWVRRLSRGVAQPRCG